MIAATTDLERVERELLRVSRDRGRNGGCGVCGRGGINMSVVDQVEHDAGCLVPSLQAKHDGRAASDSPSRGGEIVADVRDGRPVRWEYETRLLYIAETSYTPKEILNALGEDGWELVSAIPLNQVTSESETAVTTESETAVSELFVMLKRPIPEPAEGEGA